MFISVATSPAVVADVYLDFGGCVDDVVKNGINVVSTTVVFPLFCFCVGAMDIIFVEVGCDESRNAKVVDSSLVVLYAVTKKVELKQK